MIHFLRTAGEPQFAELIRNVTVTLGREVVLSCVVDNLAEYKVRKCQSIVARRILAYEIIQFPPREILCFCKIYHSAGWAQRNFILIDLNIPGCRLSLSNSLLISFEMSRDFTNDCSLIMRNMATVEKLSCHHLSADGSKLKINF